jgi:uncharacterized membrane protein YgdD (TMEM256/DUF423 family)
MNSRMPMIAGLIFAGLAVALGAFGAHALESRIPIWYPEPDVAERMKAVWETGVRYEMYHAFALVMLGIWGERHERRTTFIALLFIVGILLFSGCLYALVLTNMRSLGRVVPIGGLAFILGWILWLMAVMRKSQT